MVLTGLLGLPRASAGQQSYLAPVGGSTGWAAKIEPDGQFFPAIVLELAGGAFSRKSDPNTIGDSGGIAQVEVYAHHPGEKVQVTVQLEGLSEPSRLDAELPHAGQLYTIAPFIRYQIPHLARIAESFPTTATFTVTIDGASAGEKTLPVRVHSVNDVPIEMESEDGKVLNTKFLFAGYVDENNPVVQEILREALRWRAVDQITGYQMGSAMVQRQVFAVWNVLQRRHIHYSNTATASAADPNGRVVSQTVRFIDQSINDQQANCVDGTVLFASILYKIGIDPVLILKPGHMFLGYYIDPQHRHLQCLETTMVGNGPLPGPLNIPFGTFHPIQATVSYREFLAAEKVGTQEFYQTVYPALLTHASGYYVIGIRKARRLGVNPIPRGF